VDRKYGHRGYRDAEKQDKKDRSHDRKPPQGGPRADQFGPRTPRMVGTVTRARCSNCGAVLTSGFDPNGQCPKCAFELHSCKQCAYFDTAARFECMQPVLERIPRKDQRNDCRFYEFRTTIEKDTAPSAPAAGPSVSAEQVSRPRTGRQAFDDLFKK